MYQGRHNSPQGCSHLNPRTCACDAYKMDLQWWLKGSSETGRPSWVSQQLASSPDSPWWYPEAERAIPATIRDHGRTKMKMQPKWLWRWKQHYKPRNVTTLIRLEVSLLEISKTQHSPSDPWGWPSKDQFRHLTSWTRVQEPVVT